jgi:hypothetical protein
MKIAKKLEDIIKNNDDISTAVTLMFLFNPRISRAQYRRLYQILKS